MMAKSAALVAAMTLLVPMVHTQIVSTRTIIQPFIGTSQLWPDDELAAVCISGSGFDPTADKVILTGLNSACGRTDPSGGVYASCGSVNATASCGASSATQLACGPFPSWALPSLSGGPGSGILAGMGAGNLPECFVNSSGAVLPDRIDFYDNENYINETYISDGASDMYDNGNYLQVYGSGAWSGNLEYTTCGEFRSAGVSDVMYSTCYANNFFTAIVTSPSESLTGFRVSGDVGADGDGIATGGLVAEGSQAGTTFQGFFKSVHDGGEGDPTVNHVVVVAQTGWAQTFSMNTDSDQHELTGNGTRGLIYVLYAGHQKSVGTALNSEVVSLIEAIVKGCLTSTGSVCICDASRPGGCSNQSSSSYSVNGSTFQPNVFGLVTADLNSNSTVTFQEDPAEAGMALICISGVQLTHSADRVIVVNPSATCGAFGTTAAGNVYLNCTDGASVCGCHPDRRMLACRGLPLNATSPYPGPVSCSDSAELPSLNAVYSIQDIGPDYISDGGGDMYDNGNYLSVTAGSAEALDLTYSSYCGEMMSADVGDIMYSTCFKDNFFVAKFISASSNITGFRVSGDLGADGDGSVTGGRLNQSSPGGMWGFYKSVYGTSDPSVNHLIMVPSPSWNQTFPTDDTNLDDDAVDGTGVSMLIFVLFGKNSGTPVDLSDFSALLNRFASFPNECANRGKACICDESLGPCNNNATSYTVTGPVLVPKNVTRAGVLDTDTIALRDVAGGLGLSGVCIKGNDFNINQDKAIVILANGTCGTSAPLGGAYLSCNAGSGLCGCNGPTTLACGGFPNGHLPIINNSNLSLCLSSVIGIDILNRHDVQVVQADDDAGDDDNSNDYYFNYYGTGLNYLHDDFDSGNINDGGHDMFDTGNRLHVTFYNGTADEHVTADNLTYSPWCGMVMSAGVGDITYSTCNMNGYFTAEFNSPSGNITGFSVTGNLGADGDGVVAGGGLNQSGMSGYFGFYKTVFADEAVPSVNHLIVVPRAGWNHTFSSDAGEDDDEVVGPGVMRLVYVMFGGSRHLRAAHEESVFAGLFNGVVGVVRSGQCQIVYAKTCVCDADLNSSSGCTRLSDFTIQGPIVVHNTSIPLSVSMAPTTPQPSMAPTPPSNTRGSASGSSAASARTGLIIGVVIGGVVFLALVIGAIVMKGRRKQGDDVVVANPPQHVNHENPAYDFHKANIKANPRK